MKGEKSRNVCLNHPRPTDNVVHQLLIVAGRRVKTRSLLIIHVTQCFYAMTLFFQPRSKQSLVLCLNADTVKLFRSKAR